MQKGSYYKKKYNEKEMCHECNEDIKEEGMALKDTYEKTKKTKDCGFINVTDPNLRKTITDISKCPGDATNFTFWFQKSDNNHWGLTIKSIPKKTDNDYEKMHGMLFHSQHTWKITWYNDNGVLKVAQHSKSLADDIAGSDYNTILKIYNLYKSIK